MLRLCPSHTSSVNTESQTRRAASDSRRVAQATKKETRHGGRESGAHVAHWPDKVIWWLVRPLDPVALAYHANAMFAAAEGIAVAGAGLA